MVDIFNEQVEQGKVVLSRSALKLLLAAILLLTLWARRRSRRKPGREDVGLQADIVGDAEQKLHQPPFHIVGPPVCPSHQVHESTGEYPIIDHPVYLGIDQGVEKDRGGPDQRVIVGHQHKLRDGDEYLRARSIRHARVRSRATGLVAEDGVQALNTVAGVGGDLPGGEVAGAPYLLEELVSVEKEFASRTYLKSIAGALEGRQAFGGRRSA
jgi:hypothetical protein